jgi:3-dehydroquinate synthetase
MAADVSQRLGWIDPAILERTIVLLKRANLPTEAPQVCFSSVSRHLSRLAPCPLPCSSVMRGTQSMLVL